jgi:DNA-binding NtrC family response regulator
MGPAHFLVVEDDPALAEQLSAVIRSAGHQAVLVSGAREAARALEMPGLDVLVIGLGTSGLDLAGMRRALAPEEPTAPESLEEAERRHLARALDYTGGNKRQAAQLLGIARSTLLAKARKYGLAGRARGQERPGR